MFMRNRLARKMAAEMRGATCAGTQTSKAPTLSGPSVTNHYSVSLSLGRREGQKSRNESDYYGCIAVEENRRSVKVMIKFI